jgi:hypothetical protein
LPYEAKITEQKGELGLRHNWAYLGFRKKSKFMFRSLFLCLFGSPLLLQAQLPTGWYPAGSNWKNYSIELKSKQGRSGGTGVRLECLKDTANGYGSLMQDFLPGAFLGKRIRISAWAKTKGVEQWAGIWVQVAKETDEKPLCFDNMADRPISGDTDWKLYELVVDVPWETKVILIGGILNGTGILWLDDFAVEVVDRATPTTGRGNNYFLPLERPTNLSLD